MGSKKNHLRTIYILLALMLSVNVSAQSILGGDSSMTILIIVLVVLILAVICFFVCKSNKDDFETFDIEENFESDGKDIVEEDEESYETAENLTVEEIEYRDSDRPKLLVAEDNDGNYSLLKAMLGSTFAMARAENGEIAVEMFKRVKPDIIMMDIRMPMMTGIEATAIIRKIDNDIPIIAQTAYAYEFDEGVAKKVGFTSYVSKPISRDELKAEMKKWGYELGEPILGAG
jgi:CheY-like chemotaxis protein